MAARKTPSAGGKPDKIMRDALMIALNREVKDSDGNKTKRIHRIIGALLDKAEEGDSALLREIFDRVDGKSPQGVALQNSDGDDLIDPTDLGSLTRDIAFFLRKAAEMKTAAPGATT
jgi:hypothetical protein